VSHICLFDPHQPLGSGPLAVRKFHLEHADCPSGPWKADKRHRFETLDVEGLQVGRATSARPPIYIYVAQRKRNVKHAVRCLMPCPFAVLPILQECAIVPAIEAQFIRLVCTENASEASFAYTCLLSRQSLPDPLGFWQIMFA
jgi:hypothetical protein